MRVEKKDFYKRLFTIQVVVMALFLFQVTLVSSPKESRHGEPKSTKKGPGGYEITPETSQGLYIATLNTPRGKINVNLPADMAAGDTISGTVYVESVGKTEQEKTRNLGELNGIVIEVEEIKDKQTPAAKKRDSWIIPAAINAVHLVFKDKKGNKLGRTEVPVSPESPVSPPGEFQLPGIGQAGNFLRITGPFDCDFKTTGVRIGDFDAEPLAESPRGLIVLTPHNVTGRTKITLKERDIEKSGSYRSVSVRLAADKLHLKSGETTTLRITINGLDRLEDEVPFRLHNKSPGIISMEGGNTRTFIIRAGDIKTGGIYTLTRTLTGKVPGTFGISARIYPGLKQCAEKLGGNTGLKYREELTDLEKEEILTMPENYFITFLKKDLHTYKTGTEPSVTPGMKECEGKLTDFLNTASPEDQQWLANLFIENVIMAMSKWLRHRPPIPSPPNNIPPGFVNLYEAWEHTENHQIKNWITSALEALLSNDTKTALRYIEFILNDTRIVGETPEFITKLQDARREILGI